MWLRNPELDSLSLCIVDGWIRTAILALEATAQTIAPLHFSVLDYWVNIKTLPFQIYFMCWKIFLIIKLFQINKKVKTKTTTQELNEVVTGVIALSQNTTVVFEKIIFMQKFFGIFAKFRNWKIFDPANALDH